MWVMVSSLFAADATGGGHAAFGTSTEPETVLRNALNMLQYYLKNDCINLVDDRNGNSIPADDSSEAFSQGEGVFGVGPQWTQGNLKASGVVSADNWVSRPLIDGEFYNFVVEYALANIDSPNKDLAVDFLLAASDTTVQLDWLEARGEAPAIEFDDPDNQITDAYILSQYKDYQSAVEANLVDNQHPWFGYGKLSQALLDFFADKGATPSKVDTFINTALCTELEVNGVITSPRYPSYNEGETCP
ncbi:MAG: hypothetical protein JW841_12650 [Deltaproteobacteria bacterium]|nr:hypothetical protein [Deltaproteobacteria bacterium]